jgi:hypothetical protein
VAWTWSFLGQAVQPPTIPTGDRQGWDMAFLFITNREFDIHFVGDENDPGAPIAAS